MSTRWLFARMKTSRSNKRTAPSAEATPDCADPGSALETAIGLTNLTALTRTAPVSEQQGYDPSVTVSS